MQAVPAQGLQETDGSIPGETIELEIGLGDHNSRTLKAPAIGTVWAPPLNAGSTTRVLLNITNNSNEDIVFDRIDVSCQCGKFHFPVRTIKARQAIQGELIWKLPTKSTLGRGSIVATLFQQNVVVAELRLAAWIKGTFDIGIESEGRRSGDGFVEWHSPIVVTSPLGLRSMQVELTEGLDGFTAELKFDEREIPKATPKVARQVDSGDLSGKSNDEPAPPVERGWIVIRAHESIVGNEYRFGEVIVSDIESGKQNKRNLALVARPPIRVSPVMLQVRESDDDSSKLKSRVLVQLDQAFFESVKGLNDRQDDRGKLASNSVEKSEIEKNRIVEQDQKLSLEARLELDGKPVEIEVSHLGKFVYRIEVLMDRAAFENSKKIENLKGHWTMAFDERVFEIPVSAVFR